MGPHIEEDPVQECERHVRDLERDDARPIWKRHQGGGQHVRQREQGDQHGLARPLVWNSGPALRLVTPHVVEGGRGDVPREVSRRPRDHRVDHREHGLELLVLRHVSRHGVGALAAHVDPVDLVLDGETALIRLVRVHAAQRNRLLLPVPGVHALDDSAHVSAAHLGGNHGAHGELGGGVVHNVVVHRLHAPLSLQPHRSPSVRVDKDLLVLGRVHVEVLA